MYLFTILFTLLSEMMTRKHDGEETTAAAPPPIEWRTKRANEMESNEHCEKTCLALETREAAAAAEGSFPEAEKRRLSWMPCKHTGIKAWNAHVSKYRVRQINKPQVL